MENGNLAEYDSQAVRAAARKLRSCGQSLESGTQPKLRSIQNGIPDHLEGAAASALQQRMSVLDTDIRTVIGGINSLARALERYAEELDRTAERLKQQMAQN